MKNNIRLVFISILLTFVLSCEDSTAPINSGGIFSGTIVSASTNEPISPAYIFMDDVYVGMVENNNSFAFELYPGEYEFIFSAIGYLDEIVSVTISGNYTEEIVLTENSEIGRVYGEFQDTLKLEQKILDNNDIATWDEKEIYDGVTGATILEDNSSVDFQQAKLFIGDSLIGYADVYGQYWIKIQQGTYPLTGKSEGFLDKTKTIKILPDSKVYVNFYLLTD
ncbi:MAG: carboxypeptidase-like regulatory domain-containing protein [Maribacter sp.]|nr:carboxypeptidase-like regulatory domain-containing protein [Maribacter sp.]